MNRVRQAHFISSSRLTTGVLFARKPPAAMSQAEAPFPIEQVGDRRGAESRGCLSGHVLARPGAAFSDFIFSFPA